MNKDFKKIDSDLLCSVSSQSLGGQPCIVYADDYLALRRVLFRMFGFNNLFYEYPFICAYGLNLEQKDIFSLAKNDNVAYIARQSKVFAQINIAKKIMQVDNFYLQKIKGESCTIAVIDTGIAPHLDFCLTQNRLVKFVDLINNKKTPYDDNGHGTFVAGIACGSGIVSNRKFAGIAPKAKIVVVKALEKNGEAGAFKILEAMQWIYDNRKKYNIRVVCMSFGSTPLSPKDPLQMGAEALWNEGIVVVAAAGNSGPDEASIKSPGTSSKIITVGALDDHRKLNGEYSETEFEIAHFSSRGPAGFYYKPDIIAPATNIMGINVNGGYCQMSGTSVATPMIAGIASLIIDKNPNITPDQLKVRLVRSCRKINNNPNDEGFGLFDAKIIFKEF